MDDMIGGKSVARM